MLELSGDVFKLSMHGNHFSRWQSETCFIFYSETSLWHFLWRQFAWNAKSYFLGITMIKKKKQKKNNICRILHPACLALTRFARRYRWNKKNKSNRHQNNTLIKLHTKVVKKDITEMWCEKTPGAVWHNSACVSTQSDTSYRYTHEEILPSWLSKMHTGKILIRLCECAGWTKSSLRARVTCIFWRYVSTLTETIKLIADTP